MCDVLQTAQHDREHLRTKDIPVARTWHDLIHSCARVCTLDVTDRAHVHTTQARAPTPTQRLGRHPKPGLFLDIKKIPQDLQMNTCVRLRLLKTPLLPLMFGQATRAQSRGTSDFLFLLHWPR